MLKNDLLKFESGTQKTKDIVSIKYVYLQKTLNVLGLESGICA